MTIPIMCLHILTFVFVSWWIVYGYYRVNNHNDIFSDDWQNIVTTIFSAILLVITMIIDSSNSDGGFLRTLFLYVIYNLVGFYSILLCRILARRRRGTHSVGYGSLWILLINVISIVIISLLYLWYPYLIW